MFPRTNTYQTPSNFHFHLAWNLGVIWRVVSDKVEKSGGHFVWLQTVSHTLNGLSGPHDLTIRVFGYGNVFIDRVVKGTVWKELHQIWLHVFASLESVMTTPCQATATQPLLIANIHWWWATLMKKYVVQYCLSFISPKSINLFHNMWHGEYKLVECICVCIGVFVVCVQTQLLKYSNSATKTLYHRRMFTRPSLV